LQWFSTNQEEYKSILHPALEQTEYPNLIMAATRHRNFAQLMEGVEAGKKMLAFQRFDPIAFYESGDLIIAEYSWTGELKQKVGKLSKGKILNARICSIFEFRDGKIFRQRNYDCYESING
jgi:hypothetical protein